ncbi:TonB-dependent receptor [Fibrella forsythiae]|uniref:TonB-dependent receptor n=1 Tax=Fibrella forsythiae TaxID=2817061 RepID=A0ABS3JK91_9BACT|nr:TonB-dependent receptor [Fibrella forsythiae]MBO0950415.1 TonB-dependent receptor [Fibrella forsythiae]
MTNATTYRFAATVLLWCVFHLPVWAQSLTLSGTVREADGSPLPGAAITIDGSLKGTNTDASGTFRLTNLRAGTYQVRVSLVGYTAIDQSVTLPTSEPLTVQLRQSEVVMDEVVVLATRANEKSAIAYTDVSKRDLTKLNLGQDLPLLLNFTPSVVTTSDAGAGVGYTGIRIRGSDATRVNVTLNGIPYNDAESQGTFWVNMPDFASSVNSVQIQRGVGTSTNGAGAFGASVNVQTNSLQKDPYAEVNLSGGSYNTRRATVQAGTGLMSGHFVVDARLSKIASDGYIDRASSDLKSFYLSGGYYSKKSFVRLNVFSGQEKTYQAWNGVPEELLATNRTYNEFTYPNQTDNYQQDQYQLITSTELSRNWRANVSLFYTKGRGYYEELKEGDRLSKYGLPNVVIRDSIISRSTIVRRRWLDNDFYGTVFSFDYDNKNRLTANIGGGLNKYQGKHFGEVISGQFVPTTPYRYYEDNATKTDVNVYAKAFYQFTSKLNAFLDLQVRSVNYSFLGFNSQLQNVQQQASLTFFNPKAGLTFAANDRTTAYASFGVGNKEPNRDDYTQSTPGSRPLAERLYDWEAGIKTRTDRVAMSLNGYYMNYRNQLVLNGAINDVGAFNRINVPSSYRAGIEAEVTTLLTKALRWSVNGTFSQNKIRNYTQFFDSDAGQEARQFSQTDIAFSPNVIAGSQLLLTAAKGLEIGLLSKYVGKQFLDNTSSDARKIDAYFVNDLRFIYTLKPTFAKEIVFTLLVNNLFSERYVSNGYTYGYVSEGRLDSYNYYYPQATRNVLAGVRVRF